MANTSESTSNEIQINVKGPSELKLQISISTDKTVKDLKDAIAKISNVEAERQRLIYSGRVLKDEDQLTAYKIQSGNTLHMVKGAAKSGGGASTSASGAPQQLPSMTAGQNPADPLTQLNSHRGHGVMAGLNPFADLGLNINDPNMMQNMMESPQMIEQMSRMMADPAMLDQMIASNPQLAPMAGQIRATFSNPQFREMIQNPETLRAMIQMSRAMHNAGMDPTSFGGGGGGGGGFNNPWFPTPPASTNPPATGQSGTPGSAPAGPPSSLPMFGFPPANPQQGSNIAPPAAGAGASPFGMVDPNFMQQLLGGMGGFGGAPSFGGATTQAPADSRPPEERFQTQLQQLQDMGFVNASQNVRALLATAGNVHAAIEYILNGGGV